MKFFSEIAPNRQLYVGSPFLLAAYLFYQTFKNRNNPANLSILTLGVCSSIFMGTLRALDLTNYTQEAVVAEFKRIINAEKYPNLSEVRDEIIQLWEEKLDADNELLEVFAKHIQDCENYPDKDVYLQDMLANLKTAPSPFR